MNNALNAYAGNYGVQYPNPNQQNQNYMNGVFASNYGVAQQKGITSVAVISNGEAGANDYPVAAGNTAVLIDFGVGKFWLKTTDVYGRPLPLEDYSFFRNVNQQVTQSIEQNQNEYVKREDFESLTALVKNLCQELGVDKNAKS